MKIFGLFHLEIALRALSPKPTEPVPKESAEQLFRRLMASDSPPANACYVLAAMLERKRVLKQVKTEETPKGRALITNRVPQATCSSCLTRNYTWTNWKMCKTRWQSYFAKPRKTDNVKQPADDHRNTEHQVQDRHERLISVTEAAARKLASLLEEKGQQRVRCASR